MEAPPAADEGGGGGIFPRHLDTPYMGVRDASQTILRSMRAALTDADLIAEIGAHNDALACMARRACNYAARVDELWALYAREQRAMQQHASRGLSQQRYTNETRVAGARAFAFLVPTDAPLKHSVSGASSRPPPPQPPPDEEMSERPKRAPSDEDFAASDDDSLEEQQEWHDDGERLVRTHRPPPRAGDVSGTFDTEHEALRDWADRMLRRNARARSSTKIVGKRGNGHLLALELARRCERLVGLVKRIGETRASQRRAFVARVAPRTLASERATRTPASGFVALPSAAAAADGENHVR